MPAKINHLAIVSEKYAIAGKFYEAMFGMRTSPNARPARAVTVGDGYVGLNINPRFIGRPACTSITSALKSTMQRRARSITSAAPIQP